MSEKISEDLISDNKYQVPNLRRALSILEFLAVHPYGCSMSQISEYLAFPKNSVFRILSTLEEVDYVLRDAISKKYFLSHKFLRLGYASLGEHTLIEKSIDVLRYLRDEVKETALLGTITQMEGIVLEQIPSNQMIRFMVNPGTHFSLHASAPGKAMLAYLPANEQDKILDSLKYEKFNHRTITNREDLFKELQKIYKNGYAVDNGEEHEGIFCIGSPIMNQHSYPVAAIWVTGLTDRLAKVPLSHLSEIIIKHALQISKRLGYTAASFP